MSKAQTEFVSTPAQFSHPGKKVFVLVPTDDIERRKTTEALNDELFGALEHPPLVIDKLAVGRVSDLNVIYVAHKLKVRGKLPDGKYGLVEKLHVSTPIDCAKFVLPSLDDGMSLVNVPELHQAVQVAAGTPNLVARRSADKDPAAITLRLFTT